MAFFEPESKRFRTRPEPGKSVAFSGTDQDALITLRNGWVLTANHVGEHAIDLGGVLYPPVPGSGVQILSSTVPEVDGLAIGVVQCEVQKK